MTNANKPSRETLAPSAYSWRITKAGEVTWHHFEARLFPGEAEQLAARMKVAVRADSVEAVYLLPSEQAIAGS